MLIELPLWWILAINCMGWPLIQMGLAWIFTRLPEDWFDAPTGCKGEEGFYRHVLHVRCWKDRLPDAAGWFAGGFAKRSLAESGPLYLQRFVRETWRGELCHWSALAFTPVFFLWNPWWGDLICLGYAIAANLPCIIVQRHNRLRLRKLLARMSGNLSQDRR
jgi:glycosyl-4,4'-diaponeurosporenoate acyltransferase